MIRAVYTHGGKVHRLTIEGHSGYAPQGQDIVCAGASMLMFALAEYLEGFDGFYCSIQPGNMTVECRSGKHVHTAFEVTATGFRHLADAYPENVIFHSPTGADSRERP